MRGRQAGRWLEDWEGGKAGGWRAEGEEPGREGGREEEAKSTSGRQCY